MWLPTGEEVEIEVVNNVPYLVGAIDAALGLPCGMPARAVSKVSRPVVADQHESEPPLPPPEDAPLAADPDHVVWYLGEGDDDDVACHDPIPRKNLRLEAASTQHLMCHKPYNDVHPV